MSICWSCFDDVLFGFDEDVLDDTFCLDVELPSNRVLWPCWRSLDAFMRRQNHEGKQAWQTSGSQEQSYEGRQP